MDDDATSAPPAPMSAARMQAEAAFAAPDSADALPHHAQITVRRKRLALAAPAKGLGGDAGDIGAENKGPRVFRIDAVSSPDRTDVPSAEPSPPDVRRPPARPLRSTRIATDKRPGRVVHVLQALRPMPRPDSGTDTPLSQLGIELAPVGTLLDEIARAQSFQFHDGGFEGDWQALSRRIDMLRLGLQKLIR